MKPANRISEDYAASGQIAVEDLADIRAAGFNSVMCNRPDSEDGGQHPHHQLIEAAAKQLGLEFAYLPVSPGHITEEDLAHFRQTLAQLPGPTFAYCRSGNRSKALYERSR